MATSYVYEKRNDEQNTFNLPPSSKRLYKQVLQSCFTIQWLAEHSGNTERALVKFRSVSQVKLGLRAAGLHGLREKQLPAGTYADLRMRIVKGTCGARCGATRAAANVYAACSARNIVASVEYIVQ